MHKGHKTQKDGIFRVLLKGLEFLGGKGCVLKRDCFFLIFGHLFFLRSFVVLFGCEWRRP